MAHTPLGKYVLTDLVLPQEHQVDGAEHAALDEAMENALQLRACGASLPIYGINGFPVDATCPGSVRDFRSLVSSPCRIALVYWGSPNWHGNNTERKHAEGLGNSSEFKTNAFESMGWLSGSAFTAMTFSSRYGVQFYHPLYNKSGLGQRIEQCGDELLLIE